MNCHVDVPFQGENNRADRDIRILFHYICITYRLQYYNGPGGPDVGAALKVNMPIGGANGYPPNSTNPQCKASFGSKVLLIQRPSKSNICPTQVQKAVLNVDTCMRLDS
jgi:hypothetical protein